MKKEALFLGQTCLARVTFDELTQACSDPAANLNTSLHNNILPMKFSRNASSEAYSFKTAEDASKKIRAFTGTHELAMFLSLLLSQDAVQSHTFTPISGLSL